MKIDSHQHFWNYHPLKDAWITNGMKTIQHDFMPVDLQPLLLENGFDGCVAVQVDQTEEETSFLLQLADENDFIKGVVGWVDLRAENIEERLQHFSQYKKLKGFRHIVQAEPEDEFLLRKDFSNGIGLLEKYGFTYDILIYPKHLPYAVEFVKHFPTQRFVIDHLAKPGIKSDDIKEWEKSISEFAVFENVYCKISGLVTEADWKTWKQDDFKMCLYTAVETFGVNRIMFGSDWPVCLLAASYQHVCEIVHSFFEPFTTEEKKQLWGTNAVNFYQL